MLELARSGVACGLAALYLEAHLDPNQAKYDGASILTFFKLEDF